jgi:hypothetical protein
MSYRRNDAEGGAWIAALALIALFFVFILLYQAVKILATGFARQPSSPLLWTLLGASVVLTLIAVAAQGAAAAVILAAACWLALLTASALIARNAEQNPDTPAGIDTALRNQWWD